MYKKYGDSILANEINIHVTNTLGGIQILNLIDNASGSRVSESLLSGDLKSAWTRLTWSANNIMSTDVGRNKFLKIIGTLVGIRILKDVTGFNKILSVGRINLYV